MLFLLPPQIRLCLERICIEGIQANRPPRRLHRSRNVPRSGQALLLASVVIRQVEHHGQ